ncbi:uncharacterized protein [Dermacentor albipictus]|uniref:uncharacterized protein n=1 Tax=Dermacentor albipictus TaxID=60249 RepID=UPI0031FDF067
MASEESRQPGAEEEPAENEVAKQSSPQAKALFTATIGASLVLFLCLGGIVFYLNMDDNGGLAPGPSTRLTGLPPKRDTQSVPTVPQISQPSTPSSETGTPPTPPTGGNQSSLHEVLQAEDNDEE